MAVLTGLAKFSAVVASAVLVSGLAAAPAEAAPVRVACGGAVRVDFTPGLTNADQTVDVDGVERAERCVSKTNPGLRSFVTEYSGTVQTSCTAMLQEGAGVQTFFWNGSATRSSTWEWTSKPVRHGDVFALVTTGTVTAGELTGAHVTQTSVFTPGVLDACTQPGGLGRLAGGSTWTFSE
ncbi:hypothetical protein ACWEGE_14975 [Amycolatopsis sp. NPDC004747]